MKELYELLKNKAKNYNVTVVEEIDSTNLYLKNNAESFDDGTVIIAKRQTSGRGRLGRSFFSEKGGLYMSVLVKPRLNAEKALFITTSAAVAVSRAIEKLSGKKAGIKWVNDIFIDGKKVCGILTEGETDTKSGLMKYAVIGIGVNVLEPQNGFNKEIENIAASVFGKSKDDENIIKLAAEILNQLSEVLSEPSCKETAREYKDRSIVIGKKVDIIQNNTTLSATVLDIDDDAAVILKTEKGDIIRKTSGEISIRL